ncbi:MAG: HPr(Ser) kinase/phosphatase [Candidatus Delongbacteria bacterium]|nr:HPr(Ser) kinase/phosphatase [Candidatus Delongbacteria bacterium]MBN2835783.1 HPr(Ser) kinase/phosphatase [Candidatus Delongbacteria bacterium]
MKKISANYFYKTFKNEGMFKIQNQDDCDLKKLIIDKAVFRPGLALVGYTKFFNSSCVQIFGKQDLAFVKDVIKTGNLENLENLCDMGIPCMISSDNQKFPDVFVEMCNKRKIPLFNSKMPLQRIMKFLTDSMDLIFCQKTFIHGTLVDVHGTGILLMGRSAIGKSEIALDLVERGHRLVADDNVEVSRTAENVLIGRGNEGFNEFMEIRGLGVINIKEIFGTRAIRMQKRVELVIWLEEWDPQGNYDRLGLDKETEKILGVEIPKKTLPVFPGKNITVICEAVALNLHLDVYGYSAPKDFEHRLLKKMKMKQKLRQYLTYDDE